MPKDLSGLPRAPKSDVGEGRHPDVIPEYTSLIAQTWYEKYLADGKDKLDNAKEGATYRASWAYSCLRRLQYQMTGHDQSDPPTVADAWRFEIGHAGHYLVQDAIEAVFPDAQREVKVDLSPLGINGGAHLDMLVTDEDGTRTAVEIKTINGYAYKMAASNFRGAPEGPKTNAVVQVCLSAAALDCDRAKVVYYSLENLSPDIAARSGLSGEIGRFCAEWTFTREEIHRIATEEVLRVLSVEAYSRNQVLAPRYVPELPPGAVIVDVARSAWVEYDGDLVVNTGQLWNGNYCNYCPYQTRCSVEG